MLSYSAVSKFLAGRRSEIVENARHRIHRGSSRQVGNRAIAHFPDSVIEITELDDLPTKSSLPSILILFNLLASFPLKSMQPNERR